jgi:hypothetical protein
MEKLTVIAISGVFSLLFTACSGRAEDELIPPEAIPEATIQFTSPLPDTTYTNGDSIVIKATAISTEDLHGFDLAIRKTTDSSNIYFIHIHNHNDTVHINEKWKVIVSSPSSLEAEIAVYLDHAGHTKKEKVGFYVQ